MFLPQNNVYEADITLLTKNDKEKGIYVKRTETFENYDFTKKRAPEFYSTKVVKYRQDQFEKSDEFWDENLPENINNRDA